MSESWKQLRSLQQKRGLVVEKLVPAARAAANQMTDAGMTRGAQPIQEVLFELDAIDQEIHALIQADPASVIAGLVAAMKAEGERE